MEKKITANKKSTNTTQSTNIQSETQKQKDETQKKKAIATSLTKDTQMPSSAFKSISHSDVSQFKGSASTFNS